MRVEWPVLSLFLTCFWPVSGYFLPVSGLCLAYFGLLGMGRVAVLHLTFPPPPPYQGTVPEELYIRLARDGPVEAH